MLVPRRACTGFCRHLAFFDTVSTQRTSLRTAGAIPRKKQITMGHLVKAL